MAVTVQQAAANALAAWLTSQLTGGITVEPRWPDPDKVFPNKAVTVIPVGPRRDLWLGADESPIVAQTNLSPTSASYTWACRFCVQDFQLDVWATDSFMRDDMMAQLDQVLVAGFASIGVTSPIPDPIGGSLLVALSSADGWANSFADFVFDGPEMTDTADQVQTSEYRATLKGSANLNMHVTATAPRLANVILSQRVTEAYAVTDPANPAVRGTATTNNVTGLTTYKL